MARDQPHALLPRVLAAPAVDLLRARVVELAVVAEAGRAGVRPVVAEAGQRPGELAHVALGVAAAGAEAEQLLQLTRVVLVDVPVVVLGPVEPQQHRRVLGDVERELLEVAERVPAQQRVLAQHQLLRDAGLRGREPVVPDERHPLDERRLRAHHPVQPPQVVVAPRVLGRERPAVDAAGPARRAASTPAASATGRHRAARAWRAPRPARAPARSPRATAAAPPALRRRRPDTTTSPR